MAEDSRIDDLRRRVQKDPASIAFAQLAEECRRAGEYQEAVDICRSGLAIHPGYLSARVTLGRALLELNQLDEAQAELTRVLESAPDNLAAIRGVAEIHHRRGDLGQALAQYRAALLLARNDPDLEETIADLSRRIEPAKPAADEGLSLQHMQDELLKHTPPMRKPPPPGPRPAPAPEAASLPTPEPPPPAEPSPAPVPETPVGGTLSAPADERATRTIDALEEWLAAIHVTRAQRRS